MSFFVLPPEINSLRMFAGAGAAPMLAAAAAWEGLAEELVSAAQSFASVTAGLAGQAWQGAASVAMTAAAAPYTGWLSAAAAQSAGAAGQARIVASIFEAAQAATVIPAAIAGNRNAFVQLVMSNLFGQNAPAIAAAESMYEEMWAADVAAMSGYYSGASSAAAQLVPWQSLLQGFPGLAGGAGGGNVGGGFTGSASSGGGNSATQNVGSGSNTVGGGGSNAASGGGVNNIGGGYANGAGGLTTGTGFAPGDSNYGTGNGANNNSVGGNAITPTTTVGSPGIGVFGVPVPIPATGANDTRANNIRPGGSAPEVPESAEVPQTPAAATPEVAASAPALGVLPTAPSDIAAKAAVVAQAQPTRTAGSGIPKSPLRASRAGRTPQRPAATQDQHDSERSAAAETAAPLMPETATGELRPQPRQTPRVQVRGG